ncbi:hypothetical protein I2W78_17760 [Streptomyces spinoverrucosus]|uniref:hypothetical protein n=1 Tax=Streptomyces spinoverrucosus TaxID=284043 RepID=UPI0018C3BBCC|nr:hypothetical protein [Streptomyces spinoverrucosus]MBG0853642.1 hypothetical protein [Streptomyces spinoverrucosus]
MFSSRSFILAPAAALTAGAALGVLAPLLEMSDAPAGHMAHLVLAAGWSWAALAFCVGLARKSRIESAVLAPASLIAAVITYYATKLERGKFLAADLSNPSQGAQLYWDGFSSKTVFWCAAAATLGALLGLAGNLARNRGIQGLPFRTLVPLIAFIETSERLRVEASLQGAVAGATWSVTRLVAVTVFVVLVGQTVINLRPRASAGQGKERTG